MQEDRALSGDEAQSLSYSEASTDPLEDFLNRYSFTFSPAYCLKVRKSASGAIVGLNLTLTGPQQGVALKLKPCGGRVQRWVRKAVISQPNRDIRLYSAKIGIWKYLHVQFVGLHDFDSHRTSLSWKIKTKWAIDQHSILNKQKFAVNELLTLRTHSKIQHNMPELEGSVAVSRQQRDMDTNFERGYCHITIPKVEAVINLDNLRRYASRFRGRQPAPLPVGAEDAGSDPDADSELGSSTDQRRAGQGSHRWLRRGSERSCAVSPVADPAEQGGLDYSEPATAQQSRQSTRSRPSFYRAVQAPEASDDDELPGTYGAVSRQPQQAQQPPQRRQQGFGALLSRLGWPQSGEEAR